LYDERAGWSENDMRNGLFRGHILIRVSCLYTLRAVLSPLRATCQVVLRVFRNKTAAEADRLDTWFDPTTRQKGPKCLLERIDKRSVSRGMIAYAAVQVIACYLWIAVANL
jgi:hypothetical protein